MSGWEDDVTPHELTAVAASGAVDEPWYFRVYPDVARAGRPALLHYLTQGWREGRDPGPAFSTTYYLRENADVAASGKNPLVHYATQGWKEGRLPAPGFKLPFAEEWRGSDVSPLTLSLSGALDHLFPGETGSAASATLPDLTCRADRPAAAPPAATGLRTVAFYLPQFHPIPENDEWWGEGFTEWTNVRRGLPLLEGHHQPHIPGELGYYDLRDPEVMRRQVELAQLHGVTAFCFYTYWFGGKRLLQRPVEAYLDDPTLALEFCVCWANENWTRAWDGADEEILVGQQHSPEDDIAFIAEMSTYLCDPRYVRVGGRPVLLVYRPSSLPDAAATAARWREWCRNNGVGEILLAYVQSFDKVDPADIGFDYAVEFPPNNTAPRRVPELETSVGFEGLVYDWAELAGRSRDYAEPTYPLWRGVCPSWDNGARRGNRSAILWGSNPEGFREWLVNAGTETVARCQPDERLVFINAWNEWAEGAHLEPDVKFGYQWLHAVRDAQVAIAEAPAGRFGPGVVVVTHDMHKHGAQMLALSVVRMLCRLGVPVEVVALGEGELRASFEEAVPTHIFDDPGGAAATDLARRLVVRGFTTALCNTSVSGLFAGVLRMAGADVSGLVHEMPSVLADPAVRLRSDALAAAAHRLYFPADRVATDYPSDIPPGCDVIIRPQGLYRPMSIDTSRAVRDRLRKMLDIPPNAAVVLGVGFGDHRKGLDLFAAAAQEGDLTPSGAEVHYVWIGQPDLFDSRINEAAASAGIAGRLHMVGFVEDPEVYYAGADLLALTSREDPFPSVVLEAMAVGLPVVAFRGRTGQDDLLERGHCCLVDDLSVGSLLNGVARALRQQSAKTAAFRANLIRDEFHFRRYVMDLLAPTPAALKRVSVVVPNYGYERFIADRLAQIVDQTYPVYEIVVLDDASADRSVEVITRSLAEIDIPVRLEVNDRNSGSVFAQWAKGAALATGDLIWIAEADDVAAPEFLERLVPAFRRVGTVLAYCQSQQIGSGGETLADNYHSYVADVTSRDWKRRYTASGDDEVASCFAVKNVIPNVSAVLFEGDPLRHALETIDLSELPTAGDWRVYVEVLRQGDITYEPVAMNGHRRHASSVVATNLGREHLIEILMMQIEVCQTFAVPDHVRAAAVAYDELLHRQFGLGDAEDMRSDAELGGMLKSIQSSGSR